MKHAILKSFCGLGLITAAGISSALEPIPTKEGFVGYINLGAGGLEVESNMIAGNGFGDFGDRTISSLTDSPESTSDSIPLINGEVAYTFAAARTQLYFGNQLEDFIQFDFTTLLGVRHEFSDKSLIAVSYVFSAVPTEVWEDPYLINQPRSETDRDSQGMRLEWDKVAGTKFGVQYTFRNIEIDNELSGDSLGLSASDLELLDREGKTHNLELKYGFNFNNGHLLQPRIKYTNRDLDGKAMSSDKWLLGIIHTYDTKQYAFVTTIDLADEDYDESNPIYNKTRNDDRWGGSFTAAYKRPFGLKGWNLLGSVAYYDSDSNINFYDTNIKFFSISALYRF